MAGNDTSSGPQPVTLDPTSLEGIGSVITSQLSSMFSGEGAGLEDTLLGLFQSVLQAIIPRIVDYASSALAHATGVNGYTNSAFSSAFGINTQTGMSTFGAAVRDNLYDKDQIVMSYAKSLGFTPTDPGDAYGNIRGSGFYRQMNDLFQYSTDLGYTGGGYLDPNAQRVDAARTARVELFNESMEQTRQAVGQSDYLQGLFEERGMDYRSTTAAENWQVFAEERARLVDIVSKNGPDKADAQYKLQQLDEAKDAYEGAYFFSGQFSDDDFQYGAGDRYKDMLHRRVAANINAMSFDYDLFQDDSEGFMRTVLSGAGEAAMRNAAVTEDTVSGLFAGRDVSSIGAGEVAKTLQDEIDRVSADTTLGEDERNNRIAEIKESETYRNAHLVEQYRGNEEMSDENREILDENIRMNMAPKADAVRRQELAIGFGMMANEAYTGNGYMEALAGQTGSVESASHILAGWAASDRFKEDVRNAYGDDTEGYRSMMEDLYGEDPEKAAAARRQAYEKVVEYQNSVGDTALGREIELQQHALSVTNNAEEAESLAGTLKALFGTNTRSGMSERTAEQSNQMIEYLRQIAGGKEDLIRGMDSMGEALREVGIESFDRNGNHNVLATQLYAQSLGLNIDARTNGMTDKNVVAAMSEEAVRDFAGSRESRELAKIVGYASMMYDDEGNRLYSDEDLNEFAIKAAQEGMSVAEIKAYGRSFLGNEVVDQMDREMATVRGLDNNSTEAGLGILDDRVFAAANKNANLGIMMQLVGTNENLAKTDDYSGNLKALMSDRRWRTRMEASGLTKEKVDAFAAGNTEGLSSTQLEFLESIKGLDIRDKDTKAALEGAYRRAFAGDEGRRNIGGADSSGRTYLDEHDRTLADDKSRDLSAGGHNRGAATADADAAKQAGMSEDLLDPVGQDPNVRDAKERASRAIKAGKKRIEHENTVDDVVSGVNDAAAEATDTKKKDKKGSDGKSEAVSKSVDDLKITIESLRPMLVRIAEELQRL